MSAGVVSLVGRLRVALGPEAADADLLRAYAHGRDADAFAALVRRHGPRVWAVCRRAVGDRHAAEDAFQAVFLVLARRAAGLAHADCLGGWLHVTAVNVSRRARTAADRRKRREVAAEIDTAAPPPPEPPDERALAALDEELARLPAKLRDAVVLCELDGLSRRDAAERLGIPEGTLSSRLAAARKRLAERLRDRGVGPELLAVPVAAMPASLAEAACGLGAGAVPAPAVAALAGGTMRALLLKGLAAGAVACGLVVAGLSNASSAPAPLGPRLAISFGTHLAYYTEDGREVGRYDPPAADGWPVWQVTGPLSTDGTRLILQAEEVGSGISRTAVARLDRPGPLRPLATARPEHLLWTADGGLIWARPVSAGPFFTHNHFRNERLDSETGRTDRLFVSPVKGDDRLLTADTDTPADRRSYRLVQAVSRTGRWLLTADYDPAVPEDDNVVHQPNTLSLASSDGVTVRRLTAGAVRSAGGAFTPDGRTLVYQYHDPRDGRYLGGFAVTVPDGEPKQLVPADPVGRRTNRSPPVWEPTGERWAQLDTPSGETTARLVIRRLGDGREASLLLPVPVVEAHGQLPRLLGWR